METVSINDTSWKAEYIQSWFLEHGGKIHPAVEIAIDASMGYHLCVRKGQYIDAEDCILSCPQDLTLSILDLQRTDCKWPEELEVLWRANPEVGTRFFLIEQYLKGEDSFWWPYIQLLPQPTEPERLQTPLWYDEDDCAWIQGTNLGASRITRMRFWHHQYSESIALLARCDASRRPEIHLYDWTLFKWAATILTSRCFPGTALVNRQLPKNNFKIYQVLIPLFDLANHNPFAEVTWAWGTSHCSLYTDKRVEGGQQIWNNYGPKGNEELIMGYGFSIFHNRADRYALALSTSESSNLNLAGKVQEDMLRTQNDQESPVDHSNSGVPESPVALSETSPSISTVDAAFVSTNGQILSGQLSRLHSSDSLNSLTEMVNGSIAKPKLQTDIFYLRLPQETHFTACSQELLDVLSFMVANNRELVEARTDPRRLWIEANEKWITHNKVRVACQLVMVLQKQLSNITKYDKQLPQWPKNEKQFHAARYRRSQVHILTMIIGSFTKLLNDIMFGLDKHVARLEDILLESPGSFISQFRAAIHHSLRTRNPSKIRKSGHEEFVYTLWLCTLWLFYGSEASDHSTLNGTAFHMRLHDWIIFVRSQYCHPPGWEHIHCGDDANCALEKKDIHEVDAAVGDFNGVDFCLKIVRAAAVDDPKSLYADSKWTAGFLWWGYNIIMQEGFMYPGNDTSDDEFAIFLEMSPESDM